MNAIYTETAKRLRAEGCDGEYIAGWCSGYLGNPEREAQTTTEAYQAGYADGANDGSTEHAADYRMLRAA